MLVAESIARGVAQALVEQFDYGRKRARLYPSHHGYARESASIYHASLQEALKSQESVTISVIDQEIYVNGMLLPSVTLSRGALIEDLTERKLLSITFHGAVTVNDIMRFLPLTSMRPEEIENAGGWPGLLASHHVNHIEVETFIRKASPAAAEDAKPKGDQFKVSTELYRQAIEAILQAYADARSKRKLNVEMVAGVVGFLVSSLMDNPEAVRLITELKQRDEYTLSHSVNVAVLSLLMGSKLSIPTPLLQRLGVAALLHDIGKASVPESIINKTEKLSRREWDIMQSHSLMGAKLLAEQERMDPLALVVAAEHHAREDLGGYPKFHAHHRLHAVSKIVAIADTYDALTSDRSYRRALLPDQAIRILIEGRGTQFDPGYLKVFVQLSGMYPVGTLLELDNGNLAIVERPNSANIFRPFVKVVEAEGRRPVAYPIVDLSERDNDGSYRITVVRAIDPDSVLINLAEVF